MWIAYRSDPRSVQSVLGRNWLVCLRSPDFEGHAAPYVKTAYGVPAFDRVVEPHLNRDRTEIVANKATEGYLRLVATQSRCTGDPIAGAVGRRLGFEIGNRTDLPLTDLIEGGQITEKFIARSVAARRRSEERRPHGHASRGSIDIIAKIGRKQPISI